MQVIAVLVDVLDQVRDAVSAAWALLGNRLGAQAGVADPNPDYLASLHRRLAHQPAPELTLNGLRSHRRVDLLAGSRGHQFGCGCGQALATTVPLRTSGLRCRADLARTGNLGD